MARAIKRWKIDGALPSPGEGGRGVGGGEVQGAVGCEGVASPSHRPRASEREISRSHGERMVRSRNNGAY